MRDRCPCGKPAHPCYLFRCEDCWVDAQISKTSERRPSRMRSSYVPPSPFVRLFKKAEKQDG